MKKLALLFALCSAMAFGQEAPAGKKKPQYVAVPREQVLIVIVNQPDSPVRIEDATCLFSTDKHRTTISYRARNVSSKSITAFTVVSWDIGGAGGTLPRPPEGFLPPGGTVDSFDVNEGEIVPITSQIRGRLEKDAKGLFEGSTKEVYFLLVDQVQFADGSTYKDQAVSQALTNYLSDHNCRSEP